MGVPGARVYIRYRGGDMVLLISRGVPGRESAPGNGGAGVEGCGEIQTPVYGGLGGCGCHSE